MGLPKFPAAGGLTPQSMRGKIAVHCGADTPFFTGRGIMPNYVTALLAGIGMGMLVGGLLAVVGGEGADQHTGVVLASFGSGIFTFSLLARRKG